MRIGESILTRLPARIHFKIMRVGYLKCYVEPVGLPWHEALYVAERYRGLRYAQWLVAESLRMHKGPSEVDMLRGVPELPKIYHRLGFRRVGTSRRYERCSLWERSENLKVPTIELLGHRPTLMCMEERYTTRFTWRRYDYRLAQDGQ